MKKDEFAKVQEEYAFLSNPLQRQAWNDLGPMAKKKEPLAMELRDVNENNDDQSPKLKR
jgi:DnaJ-class molecular chaperone